MVFTASWITAEETTKTEPAPSPPIRIERLSTRYEFQNDGTGRITTEMRVRVLSEMGRQGAGQPFVLYASRSEEASIEYVRTIKADGHVLDADPGAPMEVTPPPTAEAPQFSDVQAKVKLAPSVDVGDAVEFRTVRSIVHPLKPGDFWAAHVVASGVPVDGEEVVLDAPADRTIAIRWDPKRPPRQESKDDRRTWRWAIGPTDGTAKGLAAARPLFVASTMTPDQLAAYYLALQTDRSAVTPEIHAKADELTAGMTTPRQKLDALYGFVAASVRYVSVSFGIGGFQPHPPAEVLRNRYGDCKDKDLLLRTLLAAVGIGAQPVLVNSVLGVPEPEVGAPLQFDHVMTLAFLDGTPVWLDSTSGLAPPGVFGENLRGRKSLAATPEGARLVEIPKLPATPDHREVTMSGTLDAVGGLAIDMTVAYSGAGEDWIRGMLRLQSPGSNPPLVEAWGALAVGEGSKVDGFESSEASALAVPLHIKFKVSTSWIQPTEMKSELSLPSILLQPWATSGKARSLDDGEETETYRLVNPGDTIESFTLTLDPSYAVTAPAPVKIERPFAAYESAYSVEGHTLTARRSLRILGPQLLQTKLEDLIAFAGLILGDLDQKVVVRRSSKPDLRKLAEKLDAGALNAAGADAVDGGDFELARDLLKLATEKDPKHKYAWNNLGRAQMGLSDLDAAEQSLKKALEINPKDPYAHTNLGLVAWRRGELPKAEAEFRKQLETTPLDPLATSKLGWLLADLGRWAEAADVLARAARLKPDDAENGARLTAALAKIGHAAEARAKAEELLAGNPKSTVRLQIARILAEEGIDPDRANAEAEQAIREAASRCRDVSLDSVTDDHRWLIWMALVAEDVRGIAAYQKGELDRAIALLEAAFGDGCLRSTAWWLSRAYARRGDGATGLRYYSYASHLPEPPKDLPLPDELRDYLTREFKGDSAAQKEKIDDLWKERPLFDRIYPENGEFVMPDASTGKEGITFTIRVLVDEKGAVEDARAEGGAEPFLAAALKDVRRIRFRPLGLPDAQIRSVRRIEFFYLPTKEVRAFWRFEQPASPRSLNAE